MQASLSIKEFDQSRIGEFHFTPENRIYKKFQVIPEDVNNFKRITLTLDTPVKKSFYVHSNYGVSHKEAKNCFWLSLTDLDDNRKFPKVSLIKDIARTISEITADAWETYYSEVLTEFGLKDSDMKDARVVSGTPELFAQKNGGTSLSLFLHPKFTKTLMYNETKEECEEVPKQALIDGQSAASIFRIHVAVRAFTFQHSLVDVPTTTDPRGYQNYVDIRAFVNLNQVAWIRQIGSPITPLTAEERKADNDDIKGFLSEADTKKSSGKRPAPVTIPTSTAKKTKTEPISLRALQDAQNMQAFHEADRKMKQRLQDIDEELKVKKDQFNQVLEEELKIQEQMAEEKDFVPGTPPSVQATYSHDETSYANFVDKLTDAIEKKAKTSKSRGGAKVRGRGRGKKGK